VTDVALVLDDYHRAAEAMQRIVEAVPAERWGAPSACDEWTLADVLGHVVWGQRLVWSLATEGKPHGNRDGAPGAPHPQVLLGQEPVRTWRDAWQETDAILTPSALERVVEVGPPFGTRSLAGFVGPLATVDLSAHTWDIGSPAGIDVALDESLISRGYAEIVALNLPRNTPGGLKDILEPPEEADAQTRFLAYLGRRAW
jgi:uncharacterized protein (TIGR03086 family)